MFKEIMEKQDDLDDLSKYSNEALLLHYESFQKKAVELAKRAETTEWFRGQLWGPGIRPATPGESSRFTEKAQQEEEAMLAKLNNFRGQIEKRGLKAPTMEERGL